MNRGQSIRLSIIETWTSTIVGYGLAVLTQMLVFPLYGLTVPVRGNLQIGAIFTVVSLIRGYVLRRVFNAISRG